MDGTLPAAAWGSGKVLLMGYGLGIALASLLTALAIASKIGTDFLETIGRLASAGLQRLPDQVVADPA